MERNYVLPPMYLPYGSESFEGHKLHSFQSAIRHVNEQSEDCLIVTAPTGSGKTYAFGLPTVSAPPNVLLSRKTLIVAPTNALIDQIAQDLTNEWSGKGYTVRKITASDLQTRGLKRPFEIFQIIDESHIIVSNPDILSLVIAGHYYRWLEDGERLRQWTDIFRRISTMIFDEYHIYSESQLAKVLAFLVLAKGTGNDHLRYVFTSGTPNPKLTDVLADLGLTRRAVEAELSPEGSEKEGRKYKGKIELTFTDQGILDALKTEKVEVPTLFLFDRVRGCEEGAAILTSRGLNGWKEFSGFESRSKNKGQDGPGKHYCLATSAGEVGINILNLEVAHIEPGRYLENFWQRLGRAARGRDAKIVVHATTEMINSMPLSVETYYQLANAMEDVALHRTVYLESIKSNLAAYLFLVWRRSGNKALRDQVLGASRPLAQFNRYLHFHGLHERLRALTNNAMWRRTLNPYFDWWQEYFQAFGWFRGQSMNVPVIYREDRLSEADIRWLKRNCIFHVEGGGDDAKCYVIQEFRDKPQTLALHYEGPSGILTLEGPSATNEGLFRKKWEKELVQFLIDAFEYDDGLRPLTNEIRALVPSMLRPMTADLLKPKEVETAVDDPFL